MSKLARTFYFWRWLMMRHMCWVLLLQLQHGMWACSAVARTYQAWKHHSIRYQVAGLNWLIGSW